MLTAMSPRLLDVAGLRRGTTCPARPPECTREGDVVTRQHAIGRVQASAGRMPCSNRTTLPSRDLHRPGVLGRTNAHHANGNMVLRMTFGLRRQLPWTSA